MKGWQFIACISGAIVTCVMALAAVSYTATLATPEPAFAWLPIPNQVVFSVLALAFDLGMIASVFGILHWWGVSRIGVGLCVALFAVASVFSVHAVRGYIALNVTKSAAPAARSADLYASLKLELAQSQAHLGRLQAKYAGASRRDRRRLGAQINRTEQAVQEVRTRLAQSDVPVHVSPMAGMEWFLAITLWFFNATCWTAWFGIRMPDQGRDPDTVAAWLKGFDLSEPQHCEVVYEAYGNWCRVRSAVPLAKYSFYARLIELGAKKFRDGRNGPTMYQLRHDRINV